MSHDEKYYTSTEVGTILESLRSDISIIAESVITLRGDVDILKTDVKDIKVRLTTVEDTIRISLPDIYSRVKRLEVKVGI
ncbi:MAG: hypothetical protein HYZ85_03290 [Candidatus Omnitrophica bacterium]|nr:hypothetical protein [Candidatus Omnitrophota bacterium]